jgi:hypothetical protein
MSVFSHPFYDGSNDKRSSISENMIPTLDYLLQRQISPQWRGMLTALAEEFETQIGQDELRQLMYRVGVRFATAHPLPPCGSTADLAHALNARWLEADWGYVELADEADYLRIVHSCAPLQAFGVNALNWTPAFLEGVYQTWLSSLGAEGLSVVQASAFDEYATVEYRLGRQFA